ncbi:class I SAM-dependent methyltransferase [Devosia sp. XGJD_8]|uniref:class I SAM-dependent methyltransferase n=1 Tax=Devosia sp. XGJD_8 TaxID=3391187 RepID=UPI003984BECE
MHWQTLSNIVLPAYFQKRATSDKESTLSLEGKKLPRTGYVAMLRGLHNWIARLGPAERNRTTWANYSTTTTYTSDEATQKADFVSAFISKNLPRTVIDMGCNTGDYSEVCLRSGASRVVGFDFDQQSLDKALDRAADSDLDFLPLFLDARNPAPSQGWNGAERRGFAERYSADAVIALAFEHHLAIAHNVPLPEVVEWIVGLAPAGIIEFVPKEDPTIQKMLALRTDIFDDYNIHTFRQSLSAVADIQQEFQVSSTGRTLFEFTRSSP